MDLKTLKMEIEQDDKRLAELKIENAAAVARGIPAANGNRKFWEAMERYIERDLPIKKELLSRLKASETQWCTERDAAMKHT